MKKYSMRPALRWFAGLVIVVSTFWNFWDLSAAFGGLPPREFEQIVGFENRFLEIKFKLWKEGLRSGDLGYATARSLKGLSPTEVDNIHWAQLRYVTIPFNLLETPSNAMYVLGDFTEGGTVPETPPDLMKLYDQGTGLVLYRRTPPQ